MNMSRDLLSAALQEAEEQNLRYYQIECGKCRHAIKVPLKQIRRYAPHTPEQEEAREES
jgi:hypothetical protein